MRFLLIILFPLMSYSQTITVGGNVTADNFISLNTIVTQSISIANTFQDVTFENEVRKQGWTHSTTVDPEDITCDQTGTYLVLIRGQIQKTGGAGTFFEGIVTLDGTEAAESAFGNDLITNNEIKNVGTGFIVDITDGQVLNVEVTAGITAAQIIQPTGNAGTHTAFRVSIIRIK